MPPCKGRLMTAILSVGYSRSDTSSNRTAPDGTLSNRLTLPVILYDLYPILQFTNTFNTQCHHIPSRQRKLRRRHNPGSGQQCHAIREAVAAPQILREVAEGTFDAAGVNVALHHHRATAFDLHA